MPDLWMDVDIALSEVPVNILPLIDDSDFKTREVSIAYNQAGMDLVWNFALTAGTVTQTAVTPTTGGLHDWAHQGDGMYTLEIPASGGTINNDTEGFGWFSGFATGVLPWRGPIIGFRAAGLNDLLIDSAYSATRGLVGTALPAAAADAAGGLPISDAGGLELDDIPITAEFEARTIVSADYVVVGDTIAGVTTVGSVSGAVGSVTGAVGSVTGAVGSVTGAVGSVAGNVDGSVASVVGAVGSVTGAVGSVAGNVDGSVASVAGAVGSVTGAVGSVTGAVGSVTGHTVQTGDNYTRLGAPAGASVSADIAALENVAVTDITQRQIPDSIPSDGTRPTIEQSLYMIIQFLTERAVSGTTVTVKKVDGSTSLLTLTLDDGTDPTSITRAS